MKQSMCSLVGGALALALSLVGGGGPLGWAAQGADSPIPAAPGNGAAPVLTLDEAIRLALANNPALRVSGARVNAAAGRAYQAEKWTNPDLELSVEDWSVSKVRGFADAKQVIGISQTLPYPGKKSLDKQVGGAGVKVSEAELALRRTEMVRDVKAGFFRVLAAERLLEVSTQLVAVAESSANAAHRRVEAGASAYQEQLRAEVQLEQARTELTGFERELVTARRIFATLLGRQELKDARLSGALAEVPSPPLMAAEGVAARHPSMAAAQANLERAQLAHRRARLEPYPDVKVGVAGGRMGDTSEGIIQLGITVPLPIIDRGKGRQLETWANVNEAEAEAQVVNQQLQREWANAQQRYRTAVAQVNNYRERILPKAGEALQLVQTGFAQGKFNFIDLVDTQRMTAESQLAYQQKLLEMNLAQAELEALFQPQTLHPLNTK